MLTLRRSLAFIFLIWTALVSGCAHLSKVPAFPDEYAKRFDRHNMWLSITYFRSFAEDRPTFDFIVTKKWEVKETKSGRKYLENYTTTSPPGMSELIEKKSLRFYLDQKVSGQYFLPTTFTHVDAVKPWGSDEYVFRDLDKTRFEISINDGHGKVVFLPAPNNYQVSADLFDGKPVGIWTTPFGPSSEFVYDLGERLTDPDSREAIEKFIGKSGTRYYLHHDLSIDRRIIVSVDKNYPRKFIIPLKNAADKWNTALGKKIFRVKVAGEDHNLSDCLSSRNLCIAWRGGDRFSFTGLTAFTEVSHDPQTGLIVGGLITVINDMESSELTTMESSERLKIVKGDFDLAFVAKAMVNSSNYVNVGHPSPNALIERLFVHEIGHFNGLSHNFAATALGTLQQPSASAMAYLPFPIAHRMTSLGPLDEALVNIIYKQVKPENGIPFCSTADALFPFGSKGNYYKRYPCDVRTIGPKADWYVQLAKVSPAGVMTAYPDIRDMPEEIKIRYQSLEDAGYPPRNILTHLGYALSKESGIPKEDANKIIAYLCSQKEVLPRIKDQLVAHHQFVLTCKLW